MELGSDKNISNGNNCKFEVAHGIKTFYVLGDDFKSMQIKKKDFLLLKIVPIENKRSSSLNTMSNLIFVSTTTKALLLKQF